jgi:hypothetical protein
VRVTVSADWGSDGVLPAQVKGRSIGRASDRGAGLAAEQLAHQRGQLVAVDRLAEKVVHAGHQAALARVGEGVGRQGHDGHRGRGPVGQRANLARGLDAVDARHVQVHQHQIE